MTARGEGEVQNEVDRARRELGSEEVLHPFSEEEANRLHEQIVSRFSVKPGARWIWEHLSLPASSRQFRDDRAYVRLPLLTSDSSEEVLFVAGSDGDNVCAYRGPIDVVSAVLGDCFAFEYIVVPPDFTWLICENHHGVLRVVGDGVRARLAALPD